MIDAVIPGPVSNVELNPRLFSSDCPSKERFRVRIRDAGEDSWEINLDIPLDPEYPHESHALHLFNESILPIHYIVKMDMYGLRQSYAKILAELYRTKDGDALLSDRKLEKHEIRRILQPFAELGHSAFCDLFHDINPLNFSEEQKDAVQNALLSSLSRQCIIAVDAKQPLFPWAFLFDDMNFDESNLLSLDPNQFWGFKYEIQERVDGTSALQWLPNKPKIVTAICSDTDTAGLHSSSAHPFAGFKQNIESRPTVDELGKAMSAFQDDCLYFYGHADHDDPPVKSSSYIKLRGNKLSVHKLYRHYGAPKFTSDPEYSVLVFLNGCNTTPLHKWNAESFVGFLCERSNRRACYIVTTGKVPEGFAAEFARVFWDRFLNHRVSIGEALLSARRALLEGSMGSPLGLMYTFLGRVDTRLLN